jgi:Xaa-Pro aminopeptidase
MSRYFSSAEFALRRKRLFDALPDGAIAIIAASPQVLRNGDDNTFAYRASSDILYLTGFTEPNCVLLFDKTGKADRFCMFVQAQDHAAEIWHGKRAGTAGAVSSYGADTAYAITSLGAVLTRLCARATQIYFKPSGNAALEKTINKAAKKTGARYRNPLAIIAEHRLVKSEAELALMRHSGQVGSDGHIAAMAHCQPGQIELALKGMLDFVFATNGGTTAYDSIVAAGTNGLCLHYPAGLTELKDGDLVLIDAGCEIEGYASDISRTFPVSGRFTSAQKEIYEVVLAAQMAAIAAVKPGVTLRQLDKIAEGVLVNGLNSLGFPMGTGGLRASDVMPHGLGHWLGLDVHDVGNYNTRSRSKDGKKRARDTSRPLVAGMVFTVEPGVYLSTDDQRIPEPYRGICVRIEDNIEVTASGALVQTSAAKTVAEIEQVMSRKA